MHLISSHDTAKEGVANMFSYFGKKENNSGKSTEVIVSKRLVDLYREQHKNYDYAISSALDSLDPESYIEAFKIIDQFKLKGETIDIKIGTTVAEKIKKDLEVEELESVTVEILLWIGAILPEV